MRARVVLLLGLFAVLACKRDDPSAIEKTNDVPSSAAPKGEPRPATGACIDDAYRSDVKNAGGENEAKLTAPPAPTTTPVVPEPYDLQTLVEDAPPGASPTDGLRALCADHPKIRACFDRVRDRMALREYVKAKVAVDAKGRLDDVTGVHDDGLKDCLLDAVAAADLPKPGAPGAWRLRFVVAPKAPKDANTVDASSVDKVWRASVGKIQRCYEKALATTPTLAGKLIIDFTIDASGRVPIASLDAASTLTDPMVVGCALGVVRAMTFPEPATGNGDVKIPINFVASK